MKIKLIPVIEIYRRDENIKSPDKGPYWCYAQEYETYNQQCLISAGFTPMRPYKPGSGLYLLSTLSETNLLLQIQERTSGYERDEICPFDGGYILNIDGVDLLYPQCCGDLGDIHSWINLSNKIDHILWQGHPSPIVTIDEDNITFDMTVGDYDEYFVPPPPKTRFTFSAYALSEAIVLVEKELNRFAGRLIHINDKYSLGINRIENLLILGR